MNKNEILDLVGEFYREEHETKEFIPGKTRIKCAGRVYDEEEMINLVDSALDFYLTSDRYDKSFTDKLSEYFDDMFCLSTNSGTSANLLAITALTSPTLASPLKKGDEVITAACGFPTTVAPIIQNNLVPRFVDVELGSYNVNVDSIVEACTEKTEAIFLAHTLGFPFHVEEIRDICDDNYMFLIEDNCDSLGTKYKRKLTGTFGTISTLSFYPAHHITTGEGGAVLTDNPIYRDIMQSLRDWGRDCKCNTGQDNKCGHRFDGQYGKLPKGYDHKYVYSHLGYNMKMTEMQAAVGLAQLEKLPKFIERRQINFKFLYEIFQKYENYFILPETDLSSTPSPFGFILTLRDGISFKRKDIINFLEKNLIQTRMLFSGNMTKQPCMKNAKYKVSGTLENTDKIMNDSFWIGVYPGITDEMICYIEGKIKEFMSFE